MIITGDSVCVSNQLDASYDTTEAEIVSVDPVALSKYPMWDWEGYIIVQELSGNDVTLNVYHKIGDAEYLDSTINLTANGSVRIDMTRSVVYKVTSVSSAAGNLLVAYRVCFYRAGLR